MEQTKSAKKWLWYLIIAAVVIVAGILIWIYRDKLSSNAAIFPTSTPAGYFLPTKAVNRADLIVPFAKARNLSYDNPIPTFKDVPRTNSAYKAIEGMYRAGLIKGCRSDSTGKYFCPSDAATRATLAVIAVRSYPPHLVVKTSSPSFSDVPPTYWAYKDIQTAKSLGYISGYGDGTFRPDVVVTRDMLAVVLSRASKQSYDKPIPSFKDVPKSYWAYKQIEGVYRAGYMSGFPASTVSPTPRPVSGEKI